ncbi:MAG: addiction module protein [Planctomycetes bacterium]|nr:addiction module protein [Planctomycetota bacterium]
MSKKSKKLLNEALRLSAKEREALAGELFESLGAADPDAERAWQAEVARRVAELDSGKIKPIPWNKARRMIFGDKDGSAQS